jgi:preprotein translocase subunit SecY
MNAALLQDDDGNTSSMRLAFLITVITALITWAAISYATKSMPEIPASMLALIGMLLAGKVTQKHIEVNPSSTTPAISTTTGA